MRSFGNNLQCISKYQYVPSNACKIAKTFIQVLKFNLAWLLSIYNVATKIFYLAHYFTTSPLLVDLLTGFPSSVASNLSLLFELFTSYPYPFFLSLSLPLCWQVISHLWLTHNAILQSLFVRFSYKYLLCYP